MWTVVSIVLVAIAVSTGTWYETSDDVSMNALAAGQLIVSVRDQHLVWTSALIGFFLKLAYGISGQTPWYGIYLLLTIAAATAAFLWAFADVTRSWIGRLLVLAFLVATISTSVTRLQYTRVAFLAVESGWLLLATAMAGGLPRNRMAAAAGGALVLLSTWVRWEVLVLGTILCAPLLLTALMIAARKEPPERRGRPLTVLATLVVMCGLSIAIDNAYYRTDASWKRFLDYQSRRTAFMDAGRIAPDQVPPAVLEHVGWSLNDLSMFQNWFGLNATVFSLENQDYVIDHSARARGLSDALTTTNLAPLRTSRFIWLFLAIAATALLLAGNAISTTVVMASVALAGGMLVTLAIIWQLPARFFEPALSVPAATALAAVGWQQTLNRRGWLRASLPGIGCAVVAVLSIGAVRELRDEGEVRAEDHEITAENVRTLQPDATGVYVAWGGDFPYRDLVTPLGGFSETGGLRVFALGWANHSPPAMRRLHELGIGDLHVDLWRKPHIFLISAPDRCQRLAEFVAAHYGQFVECESVGSFLSVQKVSPVMVRGPSINVRWQQSVSQEARRLLEQKYGFQRPRPREAETWRYELANPSTPLLFELIRDPHVEDTAGLDRETGRLSRPEPDW